MPSFSRQRNLTPPKDGTDATLIIKDVSAYQAVLMKIFRLVAIAMTLMLLFPPFRFILPNGSEINLGYSFILSPPLRGSAPGSINLPLLITQAGFVLVITVFALGWNMVHHKQSSLWCENRTAGEE